MVKNQREYEKIQNFQNLGPSNKLPINDIIVMIIVMSYIKDNFELISQKMEIAGIACLRKIASLKISPKIEKFSYQRSILKNLFFPKIFSGVDASFKGASPYAIFMEKYRCILE